MEYAKFNALCKHLGDQSLAEEDRWKSLKYVNISGQAIPGFDFQRLLREDRINFIKNEDIGPGFIILDAPNSDMGVTGLRKPIISFIPIDSVDSFTFVVTKTPEDGSNTISIYEVTDSIQPNTEDIPVSIRFTNSIYYFGLEDELKFPIIFSRKLTTDDYELTCYDKLGNKLEEKPTTIGTYFIGIECKNGYSGSATARFEIQDIKKKDQSDPINYPVAILDNAILDQIILA